MGQQRSFRNIGAKLFKLNKNKKIHNFQMKFFEWKSLDHQLYIEFLEISGNYEIFLFDPKILMASKLTQN